MKKKVFKIIKIVLLTIAVAYAVMFFDTNGLMKEVRNCFLWKVDRSETVGRPIDAYNYIEHHVGAKLGKANLTLIRLFTFHNFQDGYIWAWYSYQAYNEDGELLTGSLYIPTKWKIHKENGKWEIIEIFEAA